MLVLLVTHTPDETVNEVMQALVARGGVPIRFDTDLYPLQVQLSTRYDHDRVEGWLTTPTGRFDLSQLTSLWYRRFNAGAQLPVELGDSRAASVKESRQTLFGTMTTWPVFQVDPVSCVRRAEHKELQLRLAALSGLDVPQTLYTNDPAAVRDFYDRLSGAVVGKMQSAFSVGDRVVYTSRIGPQDLLALDQLKYCPMTFQEAIPKRLELRATVVGRRVMTACVDSQQSDRTRLDWRRDAIGLTTEWERYDLPGEVESGLLRLAAALGLNYGAADFIVTPEGRHVFLEINPGGEFLWLERKPGLPIAEHLADVLLGRAERLDAGPITPPEP